MRCRVLGPLEMTDATGEVLDLGGQKQRVLLGLLVAAGGRVVSVARLVDELWGESVPAKALTSVHSYVANLRRVLEPARPSRSPATVLVTRAPGYALVLPPGSVDAVAFEKLALSAQDLITRDPRGARERLDQAWELWRGDPFADIADAAPGLAAAAARLEQLWLVAAEDRLRARIALGDHVGVVAEAEALLSTHPLLEQAWGLLAVALYRSQRQGDALEALRRARTTLADQLGVDPGPDLRELEQAILNHDPSLLRVRAGASPARSWASTDHATQPRPAPPPAIVGRDDVLARLTGCLVDAAAGRGRLAIVTGEPGVGKTELCRALTSTARAMGLRTGWGRCDEAGGAPPMWPWSQALADVLQDVDLADTRPGGDLLAPAAGLLPALDRTDPADPTRRPRPVQDVDGAVFRLAEAVATLLRETGPCLVVLDDLHRADVDTLTLLRRVGSRLATLPALVVVTSRDAETDHSAGFADALGDLARADPVRERLDGLEPEAVASYVQVKQNRQIPAAVAQALHDRTEGNPFYLGELVRMLAVEDRLHDPAAVTTLEVPDGVRDVVRRRIGRLGPDVEVLLAAASVVGRSFDVEVLQASSGLDPDATATALDTAVAARVIDEERPGRFRFAHALIREVVHRRITASRRPELHGRVAESIERLWSHHLDDHLAQLVHHYTRSGHRYARKAWTYAVRAAHRATAQPAPAEAARLYDVALDALGRDPTATAQDRHTLLAALIVARKRAGQEKAAWRAVHQAVTLALERGDVVAAAEVAVTMTADSVWSWREYQVVDTDAVALLERLLEELPPGHPRLRTRLMAALATELYYRPGELDRTQALSGRAVAISRTTADPETLARVLELRHVVLEHPHLLDERLAAADELATLAAGSADPVALARALVFRGKDHLEAGDVGPALADYARARVLADKHAVAPILLALAYADTLVLIARGRFADAEDAAARAAALHDNTTLPGSAELPVVVTTMLHLVRGTLGSVEPVLAHAAAGDSSGVFTELHALALLRTDRAEEAGERLGPWRDQPEIPDDLLWLVRMTIRATLWSELAPTGMVHALFHQLLPYAGRIAVAGTGIVILGSLSHPLGLLARAGGDLDGAITHLTQALTDNQNAGFRAFAASSADELAATLERRGGSGDVARAERTRTWADAEASTLGITLSRA